jgi:hypothetical protein
MDDVVISLSRAATKPERKNLESRNPRPSFVDCSHFDEVNAGAA